MLEKDIQAGIVKYLRYEKIEVSVTDSSRVWGKGGGVRRSKVDPDHPDLSCVMPVYIGGIRFGLAFFIEVKTPTGAIRPGQKEKLMRLADAGALCILARTIDEVMSVVRKYKEKELTSKMLGDAKELLSLLISDRRSKDVRDKLTELETTPKSSKTKRKILPKL